MLNKIIYISCGSILIGIGINTFILPMHLLNGGMIGVCLIVNYLWGFKVGLVIFFLNIPIYFFTLLKNKTYFLNSLIGLIFTSIAVEFLFPLNGIVHLPIVLSALSGGIMIGFGIGIMVRQDACPGGLDLIAFFISKMFSLNFGIIIFLIDSTVISIGLFVLKDLTLAYSLLTILGVALTTSLLTSFKTIHLYVS